MKPMKPIKIFNYYPVPIKNAHTDRDVTGFKFPAKEDDDYDLIIPQMQMLKIYNNSNCTLVLIL